MRRIPLKERLLPNYTRGEEIFNMVSHIVGGALALTALVTCIVFAAVHKNPWGLVTGIVFGISMITVYALSSIYHGLFGGTSKKVMQVLDHCAIFFLIAGTYTPMALCVLRPSYPVHAWIIFGVVWASAALGITLNAIDLKKYSVFSMLCYICSGWCIMIVPDKIFEVLPLPGFIMLLAGGIAYTLGSILYGIGKKKKYMHSIFHLFVVLGSLLHYLTIILYAM